MKRFYTFQDGIVLSLVKCRLTSFRDSCLMYAIMCTKFDISCAYALQVYIILTMAKDFDWGNEYTLVLEKD